LLHGQGIWIKPLLEKIGELELAKQHLAVGDDRRVEQHRISAEIYKSALGAIRRDWDSMENPEASTLFWVNILERDGWIVIHVNDRPLGIVISITEAGREFLRVAGYHLGESMFVGERRNILSIKVERIPESQHKGLLPKILEALPVELRAIAFL
jgi:hypothetical protein